MENKGRNVIIQTILQLENGSIFRYYLRIFYQDIIFLAIIQMPWDRLGFYIF